MRGTYGLRGPRSFVLTLCAALVLATLAIGLQPAAPVAATHNRSAQLTWTRTSGTTVEFEFTFSARASYALYTQPVKVGDKITGESLNYGDGNTDYPMLTVTSVDTVNDVLIAEATLTHTYANNGPFTAYSAGCCRLDTPTGHINNPNGSYRIETLVDPSGTTASPVSSLAPVIDCLKNAVCQFVVPAYDPDAQGLRFRLATVAEAAGAGAAYTFAQPGPPQATNAASINATTGVYQWNTAGATLAPAGKPTYYSTQVIIENVVNSTVVSKIAVDFFIRLSDAASANQPPAFTGATPADGTLLQGTIGQSVTFNVAATDPNNGDTVTLGLLGKPTSATFTTTPGNPASGTFSWTPASAGTTLLTLQAQDQLGLGATPRSVTIQVGNGGGPSPSPSPSPSPGAPACLSPASIAFGTQVVGSSAPSQLALLNNCGNVPLTIGTASLGGANAGDFSIVSSCAGTTIAVGASCGIRVTFTPATTGARSAAVAVAFSGGTATLSLSGTGALPNPPFHLTLLSVGSCSFDVNSANGVQTALTGTTLTIAALSNVTLTPRVASGWTFTYWKSERGFMGWADPWTFLLNADHTITIYCVQTPGFSDYTPTGTTKADPIVRLAALGVIRGYQADRCQELGKAWPCFGPGDSTQRAQMAALISRGMGLDRPQTWDQEDHGNPFPDKGFIDDALWRNVGTLYYYNVARGFQDGTYQPTAFVVYAQTVSFIVRAMVLNGYWVQQPDNPALYVAVTDPTHRADLATFVKYAGALPDVPLDQPFSQWANPSTRAWFCRVEWQALNSYFGVGSRFAP